MNKRYLTAMICLMMPSLLWSQDSGDYLRDEIEIVLEFTPCYGTCPVFNLTIDGYGTVTFEGISHVEKQGIHKRSISPENLVTLLNELMRAKFFERTSTGNELNRKFRLEDNLRITEGMFSVSDLSSRFLTFNYLDQSKRIEVSQFAPRDLRAITDQIIELTGTGSWIR